jgi:hypothetical protein
MQAPTPGKNGLVGLWIPKVPPGSGGSGRLSWARNRTVGRIAHSVVLLEGQANVRYRKVIFLITTRKSAGRVGFTGLAWTFFDPSCMRSPGSAIAEKGENGPKGVGSRGFVSGKLGPSEVDNNEVVPSLQVM